MPSSDLVIRRAGPSDVMALTALANRLFQATYGATHVAEDLALYAAEHLTTATLAPQVAATDGMFLLVESAGEASPLGYLQLRWGPAPEPVVGRRPLEIVRLYLDALCFGTGCAARLMDLTLAEARQRGRDVVWLIVWHENHRAKAFYRKHGFEIVGSVPFRIGSTSYHDDLMARPVHLTKP